MSSEQKKYTISKKEKEEKDDQPLTPAEEERQRLLFRSKLAIVAPTTLPTTTTSSLLSKNSKKTVSENDIISYVKEALLNIDKTESLEKMVVNIIFLATALDDEIECSAEEVKRVIINRKELEGAKLQIKTRFTTEYEQLLNDLMPAKKPISNNNGHDRYSPPVSTVAQSANDKFEMLRANLARTNALTPQGSVSMDSSSLVIQNNSTNGTASVGSNGGNNTSTKLKPKTVNSSAFDFDSDDESSLQQQQQSQTKAGGTVIIANDSAQLKKKQFSVDKILNNGQLSLFPIDARLIKQEPIFIRLILSVQQEIVKQVIINYEANEVEIVIDKIVAQYELWQKLCYIMNSNPNYKCSIKKIVNAQGHLMEERLHIVWT